MVKAILRIPRRVLIGSVRLYQKTLSPDHSWLKRYFPYGYCRFHPTCSEYMALSLEKYGAVRGSLKGIWRILRCNPWSKGGMDQP